MVLGTYSRGVRGPPPAARTPRLVLSSNTRTGATLETQPGVHPVRRRGQRSAVMARIGDGGDLLKCSFCGKSQKQVKKLIAGPGVYICDECIDLCNEIIEEELAEAGDVKLDELPKPAGVPDLPRPDRVRRG